MKRDGTMDHRVVGLLAGLLLVFAAPARAEITIGTPLRVAILWDNSGSMYPGYTPPGSPNRKTHEELGVTYYHSDPQIISWLADFVSRQTILDAQTVKMSAFTSQSTFQTRDLTLVHPEMTITEFDAKRAFAGFPTHTGRHTYIAESLEQYSRGFEGLIWLITDNIVEKSVSQPDEDVKRFFEMLRDGKRYRAVHLYKYPFTDEETGQIGNLAVYGILVSDEAMQPATLKYFDVKFRSLFLDAIRQDGAEKLFPGQAYWKLKDLDIGALDLELSLLSVEIEKSTPGFFRESQLINLKISGHIESHLTQHRVVEGRYSLRAFGPFKPSVEGRGSEDFGIKEVGADVFRDEVSGLPVPIPPKERLQFSKTLTSRQPIDLDPEGLYANLYLAFQPLRIQYDGQVIAVFEDIKAEFETDRMKGIFGAQAAPEIFKADEPKLISTGESDPRPVSFVLETSYHRLALGALLVLLLLAALLLLFGLLQRREQFRIKIGDHAPSIVSLRPGFGSYDVTYLSYRLGRLSSSLGGEGRFTAERTSALVSIQPATQSGRWDVTIRDQESCSLSIESLKGKPTVDASGGDRGGPLVGSRSRSGPPSRSGKPTEETPTGSGPPSQQPKTSTSSVPSGGRPKITRPGS